MPQVIDHMHAGTRAAPWTESRQTGLVYRYTGSKALSSLVRALSHAGDPRDSSNSILPLNILSDAEVWNITGGVASSPGRKEFIFKHGIETIGVTGHSDLLGLEAMGSYERMVMDLGYFRIGSTPGPKWEIAHLMNDIRAVSDQGTMLKDRLIEIIDEMLMHTLVDIPLQFSLKALGSTQQEFYQSKPYAPDIYKSSGWSEWAKLPFNDGIGGTSGGITSGRMGCLRRNDLGGSDIELGVGSDTIRQQDVICYNHFIDMRRIAESVVMSGVRHVSYDSEQNPISTGVERYIALVTPTTFAELLKDPQIQKFNSNVLPRSEDSPIFQGFQTLDLNGITVVASSLVPDTRGTIKPGNKFGAGRDIDGAYIIFLGAGALALMMSETRLLPRAGPYDEQDYFAMDITLGMSTIKMRTPNSSAHIDGFTKQSHGIMKFFVAYDNGSTITNAINVRSV